MKISLLYISTFCFKFYCHKIKKKSYSQLNATKYGCDSFKRN